MVRHTQTAVLPATLMVPSCARAAMQGFIEMVMAARKTCARARMAQPVPVPLASRTAAIYVTHVLLGFGALVSRAVATSARVTMALPRLAHSALYTKPTFAPHVMLGTIRPLRAAASPTTARAPTARR